LRANLGRPRRGSNSRSYDGGHLGD